jgi:hypothetical protein
MTSTMSVAAILGVADVNDTHDYYQCSDGSKCVHDYNDLPSLAIAASIIYPVIAIMIFLVMR